MTRVTGGAREVVLLGDPVAHSLSPRMHNAGFRAAGLDAVYRATRCAAADLCGEIRAIAEGGGCGNITVPHKLAAAACGIPDRRVARLGIANVFVGIEGQVHLRNTDVDGVLAMVDALDRRPRRWAVIGTGGSARAVAAAALERDALVASISRDPGRAAQFLAWCTSIGVGTTDLTPCDLVINATPLGLEPGDPLPVDLGQLAEVHAVLDLTYRRDGTTDLVEAARAQGLEAADGREMLLAQGVAAWASWFPGIDAPIEVMRDALWGDDA